MAHGEASDTGMGTQRQAQAEDPVEVQVSLRLLSALSGAVVSPAALTLPAYAHITYHSSSALVTSPTVPIAKSVPM